MDAGSEWVNWTVDSVEMSMSVVVVGRRSSFDQGMGYERATKSSRIVWHSREESE